MSNSLRPHESQYTRPPCPSPKPEFTQTCVHLVVMPSSRLILCHPLFLLPSILPSIRVFSNESTLHMRWPNYWSFSFSVSPSKEIPGLISFRMDWLDLLAVQGTLKSLLQHHSSKASVQGRGKDGGGIGRQDHFLPHKFLKRTFQRRANFTKQLL